MASDNNNVASKVTLEDLLTFHSSAAANVERTNLLIGDYYLGYFGKNDEMALEMMKFLYNSKTFKDYSEKLLESKDIQKDGLIHLHVEELASITKCVLAMLESQIALQFYGVSLDLQ